MRSVSSLGLAVGIALTIGFGPASGTRVGAQAAPPAPPVPGPSLNATIAPTTLPTALPSGVPVPTVTPTARPGRGRRRGRSAASPGPSAAPSAPEPTATPTSPAFATLDGTWEVQLQYIDHTDYSYFDLHQGGSGGGLTGSWRVKGKPYPLAGTYDGRLIHLTVTQGATSVAFNGYVEGASDMVGLTDYEDKAAQQTAFTAEHRGTPRASPAPRKKK